MAKFLFLVFFLLTAGAAYATWYGVGVQGEDDRVESVRAGSAGVRGGFFAIK